MHRFYIINGLPYLIGGNGDTFTVRLNDDGYTVGEKVTLPETPKVTFSELSVRAKCEMLDSINTPKVAEPVGDQPVGKGKRQQKKAVE